MRIVAVTRILNEDDIVEAFVRHHATQVDHHVFLDNGSTDRTLEILKALHAEGIPLTVMQNRSVTFCEGQHNTFLFQIAVQACGADWVQFLDADEFVNPRGISLRELLSHVSPEVAAIKLRLMNYHADARDDADELLVPARITRRARDMPEVWKVCVRGQNDLGRTTIGEGNHDVLIGGQPAPAQQADGLWLAHFPERHPLQLITKAVIGRLKVLAGGEQVERLGFSAHYTRFLETMRDSPQDLLRNPALMGSLNPGVALVDDPMDYAGGPLTLTRADDPTLRAIRFFCAAAEQVARRHGRLLDENASLRAQTQFWNAEFLRIT